MRDKTILVVITILFLITGTLLLFSALNEYSFGGEDTCIFNDIEYNKGDEIEEYLYGSICTCGSGGLVECIPKFNGQPEQFQLDEDGIDTSDLETKGLDFEYSYVVGLSSDELFSIFPVEFEDLSYRDGQLVVVIEQLQSCPGPNRALEQFGFYKKDKNTLSLYNMVRPLEADLSSDCIVKLVYTFDDFESIDVENFEIRFVDDFGVASKPEVCLYNGNMYSTGDVFQNSGGDICICDQGLIECE